MNKVVCACCGTTNRNDYPQWCPMPDVYVKDDTIETNRTMNTDTPTPRTDAAKKWTFGDNRPGCSFDCVDEDFARTLERELASARAQFAAAQDGARRLREALRIIQWNGGGHTDEGLSCNGSWCAEQARAALAAQKEESK